MEHQKNTARSPEEVKSLINRIHRMQGQLSGIEKMIESNRYCGDVLIQIAAVQSALQTLGYEVLNSHMESCVVEDIQQGNTESIAEVMKLIKKLK